MIKNFSKISLFLFKFSTNIGIYILTFILFINLLHPKKLLASENSSNKDFPFGYTQISLGFSQKGNPKYTISQSFLNDKVFDFGIATFYQKFIYLKSGDTILNQTNNKLIFFEQNPYYLFLKYNYKSFYSQLNFGYYSTSNSNPYTILSREGTTQKELYFKSNSLNHYLYGSIDIGYQVSKSFSLFANFSSIEVESVYKEININKQEVIYTEKNIEKNFIFTLNLSYRIKLNTK